MALTALKIHNNTNTNECNDVTVIGIVSHNATYVLPESTDFGTAIVKSCHIQSGGTAVQAQMDIRTATFVGAGVANTVVALTYTFQK